MQVGVPIWDRRLPRLICRKPSPPPRARLIGSPCGWIIRCIIPPNEFFISWDGSTLLDWTNAPAFPWTNLQFTVTASGSETVLQLGFDNGDAFGLDDISVRPAVMPQPAMGGVHASFAGFAINVNNSVAGATYYLLSSTNLVRPLAQWIVVATNCPDGNGGFVIVLPNAISPIPGRFYMLETR